MNGILRQTVKDIPFDTQDKSAPGRIGANDNRFDAVGEVIMPATGGINNAATKKAKMQLLVGTLSHIQIYNRALTEAEIAKPSAE